MRSSVSVCPGRIPCCLNRGQQQHCRVTATTANQRVACRISAVSEATKAAAAGADVQQPGGESTTAERSSSRPQREPRQGRRPRQQQKESAALGDAIVVVDKPVTNSILRRLEEVPVTLLRAGLSTNACTYKAVAAVAAAQSQLAAAGKVLVYVPYVKSATFMAQLVTADAAITTGIQSQPLIVKASTDPAQLGNTLAYKLLLEGGAVVQSAGTNATAVAAEALRVARSILSKKGVEIGVVPQFADGTGSTGDKITLIRQAVVAQKLAPEAVILPQSPAKDLTPAATAAAKKLKQHGVCPVSVRQGQLQRMTAMLFQVAQKMAERPTTTAAASAAAAGGEAAAAAAAAAAAERAEGRGRRGDVSRPRLLLVSYTGTSGVKPAGTNSSGPTAEPAAPDAAATPAATAAAASESEVPASAVVDLELLPSRLTAIPVPKYGVASPAGPLALRKPVVATAASALPGVTAALEAKLSRLGAAYMYSDGTVAGDTTLWEAYVSLARKLTGSPGEQPLLALVRVDATGQAPRPAAAAAAVAAPDAAGKPAEQQQEASAEAQAQQQQQQQQQQLAEGEAGAKQAPAAAQQAVAGAAHSGHWLSMLVVCNDDIARSILQAPNAPLEVPRVAFKQALQLLKFAAAANTFLPLSKATATGALLLLPAVLPATSTTAPVSGSSSSSGGSSGSSSSSEAPQQAVDYRFAGATRTQAAAAPQVYDYYFRVQRLTQELPGGLAGRDVQQLRVSATTDPTKLRDAVVARMLEGQQAALRVLAPAGKLPSQLLTVAVTAVAAARVRLQAKKAGVDVAVLPLVLAAGEDEEGEGARAVDGSRVVYSLRLVPMPAAGAEAEHGV